MTSNQIAYNKLLEEQRHNFATESEAARHNLAQETEQNRTNLAHEDLANRNLLEVTRHNYATEALQQQQIANQYAVGMAQAAATRYAADVNASTQRYVANVNASTQRWVASSNASVSLLTNQASLASAERRTSSTNQTNLAIQKSRERIAKEDRTVKSASAGADILSKGIGAIATLAKISL